MVSRRRFKHYSFNKDKITNHSQSKLSESKQQLQTWTVIGIKKGGGEWLATELCPFVDTEKDPFWMARKAEREGSLILANRKIAIDHYELLAKVPNAPSARERESWIMNTRSADTPKTDPGNPTERVDAFVKAVMAPEKLH